MAVYKKPLPEVNEDSRPFWEGLRRHEFLLQQCQNCGTHYWPPSLCHKCNNPRMEWVRASGKGKVFTYAIFHQVYHEAFRDEVPYNVTIVELDEGPLMQTNMVGCRNEDLKIGMPVEVVFEDITPEIALHKFRPAR